MFQGDNRTFTLCTGTQSPGFEGISATHRQNSGLKAEKVEKLLLFFNAQWMALCHI